MLPLKTELSACLPDLSFSVFTLSSNTWENFGEQPALCGVLWWHDRLLLMQMKALLPVNKRISKQHRVKIID